MSLSEWFPDVPAWIPVTALVMDVLLLLVIFACLVGNPLEGWRSRHQARTDRQVKDLQRFQAIEADLMNAPLKQGVTAELARVKHRADD